MTISVRRDCTRVWRMSWGHGLIRQAISGQQATGVVNKLVDGEALREREKRGPLSLQTQYSFNQLRRPKMIWPASSSCWPQSRKEWKRVDVFVIRWKWPANLEPRPKRNLSFSNYYQPTSGNAVHFRPTTTTKITQSSTQIGVPALTMFQISQVIRLKRVGGPFHGRNSSIGFKSGMKPEGPLLPSACSVNPKTARTDTITFTFFSFFFNFVIFFFF